MSYNVYWDRDRLRIHDAAGREPDRDLPLAQLLAWLKDGGLLTTASSPSDLGAAASDHDHDADYVAKVAATRIADPSGGETIDAEARTALAAVLDVLEARGLMAAESSSSSGESSSGSP